MKKIVLATMMAAPVLLWAQEDFTLNGKVGDVQEGAKIFFQYRDQGQTVIDSVSATKGAFKYQGSVAQPTPALLILAANGETITQLQDKRAVGEDVPTNSLYFSKGVINFEGDDFGSAKASGNNINDDYEKYQASLAPFNDEFAKLNDAYLAATDEQRADEAFMTGLQEQANALYAQQEQTNVDFVKENPDSYVSLTILDEAISPDNLTDFGKPAYEALSNVLKATDLGKSLGTKIASMEKLAVGAVAPDFILPDTAGNDLALSSLRGKYVLVDFWASWCGPCRRENPNVVAAYEKFKDKNFTILGVSLDRPGQKDAWLKAIVDDKLGQWAHVSDLQFWNSEVVELYSIRGIPQNYLLDPEGKIVASNLRGAALEEKLAELLD